MLPSYYNWTKADGASIMQLTAITGDAGKLWPYPESALTLHIQEGMPDIRHCYISGYANPKEVEGGVKAIGELLVTRKFDDVAESGKAYMYLVAIDQSNDPWIRGPYKPYDGHYYNEGSGVPCDKLFGKIQLDNLKKLKL